MSNAAKPNLPSILQEAWTSYRRFNQGRPFNRRALAGELQRAWAKAKLSAYNACPINRTRSAITALENKNHLTQQDYARLGVLRAALRPQLEQSEALYQTAYQRAA